MPGARWLSAFTVAFLLTPALLRAQARPLTDDLKTVAEKSDFRATARHDEVVALCKRLAERSPLVAMTEIGQSIEGRPLTMLIVADPPVKTPEEARQSGKLVVLAIGNIHAGEVDGKEGLPILVREMTDSPHPEILRDVILAVLPDYNPDGNEQVSKDNRPGQVGPAEGMGRRENAQGFDLNRDFIKLEAPETRALVRWMNAWTPHIFIDCHTTNGSAHRYIITHAGPKHPAGDAGIIAYFQKTLLPAIEAAMKQKYHWDIFGYGNFNRDHSRWTTYGSEPRYSTSYAGMKNQVGVLSEGYSYAPYKDRVMATRDFVREIILAAVAQKAELKAVLETASKGGAVGEPVAIRSEIRPRAEKLTVLGFEEAERREGASPKPSEMVKPRDYTVEVWDEFAGKESVSRPAAYLLPAGFPKALELIQRHGIPVTSLRADLELPVELYQVEKIDQAAQPFQGHKMIRNVDVRLEAKQRMVPAGTYVVPATGPYGSLAVMLLEPRSEDGLTTWNVFDAALKPDAEFPVLRLPRLPEVPLLTAPVKPPADSGISFQDQGPDLSSPPVRVGSGLQVRPVPGAAGFVRWLDADHFAQTLGGKSYRVDARTGRGEPLPPEQAIDRSKLAEALAKLPGIPGGEAASLAARASLNADHSAAFLLYRGDLYYSKLDGTAGRALTQTPEEEELAEFSPNGRHVSFIRGNDLHVVDVDTGQERALTTGATDRIRHGKCDWIYFEEIFNRDWKAYWWSPDSERIAFFTIDDRTMPVHQVLNELGDARRVEETAYPRSGEPNPIIGFGIVEAAGGEPHHADLSEYEPTDFLISGAGWWPDGKTAYFYGQNRTQTWLDVLKLSPAGGKPTRLLRETTGAWVESLGTIRMLQDGSLLVLSERDGYKHVYRYAADGTLMNRLTSGEWEVRDIVRIDEAGGWVYVIGTRDDPLGLGLYRARLDGTAFEPLTRGPGTHAAVLSPDGKLFVDLFSSREQPPRALLAQADGKLVRTLDNNPGTFPINPDGPQREIVQIAARDGFPLEAEVLLPAHCDTTGKTLYPVWLATYGGPHFPTLSNIYRPGPTTGGLDAALVDQGFVVLRIDPRSASGKGARSAWSAYKHLGVQELRDIEDALAWLKQRPYVDGSRIGMSGHSYGGYLTAFCMTHSDLFAAGIAGAPVTDWHDYDSIYTERYMDTPQNNPAGYDASSVVKAADKLHGRLLILHGSMDDNVSVRNTMRLLLALQAADGDFELMIYPNARHGIFGAHYQRLQREFIKRTLGGPRPREQDPSSAAQ